MSCGAPDQSSPAQATHNNQTVLAGTVTGHDGPLGGAFVRLLDAGGDFTGEVVTSPAGDFRFYAAPGEWTVRALHRTGNGSAAVSAEGPGVHGVAVTVS